MNWIIRHSDKMEFHTHLNILLNPILDDIAEFNWLISNFEYHPDYAKDLPVNHDEEYFILSSVNFKKMIHADPQIIWAVILGIPQGKSIEIDEDNLPYADGSAIVWKNGNLQHPNAVMEIICFDSSYTIVKFKDEKLSTKFKAYFNEAIGLEKFSNDSAPNY